MTRKEQIIEVYRQMGGRCTIELLAKKVAEAGIYQEDDYADAKWAWLKKQCTDALRMETTEGLQVGYAIGSKKTQKSGDTSQAIWVQTELLSYPECCDVVSERVTGLQEDYGKLQRFLDWVLETHGKLPPVPRLIWPK